MVEVRRQILRLARVQATVLLRGATGTGKEVAARALHDAGPRAGLPFVAVNVNAVAASLFESHFFGHVAGAFTGAHHAQSGQLERAGSGTLFLDEIGDLALPLQVKLLRVLEQRVFLPVGAVEERRLEARIVTATNADLEREVEAGRFRDDLLQRLASVELWLPCLSERREDIRALVRYFATRSERPCEVDDEAICVLARALWPGNVRQLKQAVERLSLFSEGRVTLQHLAADRSLARMSSAPPHPATGTPEQLVGPVMALSGRTLRDRLASVELAVVVATVARVRSVTSAARLLGTTRKTVKKRLASTKPQEVLRKKRS